MLFNSIAFILFGIAFYTIWPLLRERKNLRWGFLLVASLFFYGWWDWRYITILVASGAFTFICGSAIASRPKQAKAFLILSIIGNMVLLATFKYIAFALANIDNLLALLGSTAHVTVISPKLPIGISFFTFMALSYTIDIYRGGIRPTGNILHFFAFMSMFPHLIAGPIIRASHLLPQMLECKKPTEEQRWEGMKLIVVGYFKKVFIADNISPFVDKAFSFGDNVTFYSAPFWWLAITIFAFQIYCDFSGYSDIARGLAKWMGYDFKLNFNHPYISSSFREFWTRWHISLSSWFRDYVYIPLGGSEKGKLRSHINMWITMLLSGFWHGAAWTFVAWGGAHAAFLSVERLTRWPQRLALIPAGRLIATLLVIAQVWVAWVFFRATSITQAIGIIKTMFDFRLLSLAPIFINGIKPLPYLGIGCLMELYFFLGIERTRFASSRFYKAIEVVGIAVMIVACIFFKGKGNAFIYFQF